MKKDARLMAEVLLKAGLTYAFAETFLTGRNIELFAKCLREERGNIRR